MDSKIGLLIQLSGVFLITVLTLFLRRSLKVQALRHWTKAWLCLSFALICLRLAFSYDQYSLQLFGFYFLSEYIFGFLLVAGCRSLDGEYQLSINDELMILPFIVIAFTLPFLRADFNLIFNVHSFILVYFFASALASLSRSKVRTFGWRVMQVALWLLVIDFVQYFVVFSARQVVMFEAEYLAFNPIIDLVLQMLLGFGMVIVLLEEVLGKYQDANEKLTKAHDRLEQLVHTDPLTEAFNRHAFYGFLKKSGEDGMAISGCVGFFDIDDLKQINDRFGHLAGDRVIRVVARSIRKAIRAEDLIYRWGGDEFFVIMIGMSAELATHRMSRIESLLTGVQIYGLEQPLDIGVSFGFRDFARFTDLEAAVTQADTAMYARKQARKSGAPIPPPVLPNSSGQIPAGV